MAANVTSSASAIGGNGGFQGSDFGGGDGGAGGPATGVGTGSSGRGTSPFRLQRQAALEVTEAFLATAAPAVMRARAAQRCPVVLDLCLRQRMQSAAQAASSVATITSFPMMTAARAAAPTPAARPHPIPAIRHRLQVQPGGRAGATRAEGMVSEAPAAGPTRAARPHPVRTMRHQPQPRPRGREGTVARMDRARLAAARLRRASRQRRAARGRLHRARARLAAPAAEWAVRVASSPELMAATRTRAARQALVAQAGQCHLRPMGAWEAPGI
jgi:hypothetical protein